MKCLAFILLWFGSARFANLSIGSQVKMLSDSVSKLSVYQSECK